MRFLLHLSLRNLLSMHFCVSSALVLNLWLFTVFLAGGSFDSYLVPMCWRPTSNYMVCLVGSAAQFAGGGSRMSAFGAGCGCCPCVAVHVSGERRSAVDRWRCTPLLRQALSDAWATPVVLRHWAKRLGRTRAVVISGFQCASQLCFGSVLVNFCVS